MRVRTNGVTAIVVPRWRVDYRAETARWSAPGAKSVRNWDGLCAGERANGDRPGSLGTAERKAQSRANLLHALRAQSGDAPS